MNLACHKQGRQARINPSHRSALACAVASRRRLSNPAGSDPARHGCRRPATIVSFASDASRSSSAAECPFRVGQRHPMTAGGITALGGRRSAAHERPPYRSAADAREPLSQASFSLPGVPRWVASASGRPDPGGLIYGHPPPKNPGWFIMCGGDRAANGSSLRKLSHLFTIGLVRRDGRVVEGAALLRAVRVKSPSRPRIPLSLSAIRLMKTVTYGRIFHRPCAVRSSRASSRHLHLVVEIGAESRAGAKSTTGGGSAK